MTHDIEGPSPTTSSQYIDSILYKLLPQPCPYSMIRIGGSSDGSYLIPNDLEGIECCFSPGVNNVKMFEDELVKRFNIRCHMCDYSSDEASLSTPLIVQMQTFDKLWLDIKDSWNSITLASWIARYSKGRCSDLILQMDIEGGEYSSLLESPKSVINRFRIIVVELHGLGAFRDAKLLSKSVGPLVDKLYQTHICVHAHPNNCSGQLIDSNSGINIPDVLEVTYLRRDRFLGDQQSWIQPMLPHPYDIAFNVQDQVPLHLNGNWYLKSQVPPYNSEIKIFKDKITWASSYIYHGIGQALSLAKSRGNSLPVRLRLLVSLSMRPAYSLLMLYLDILIGKTKKKPK
jgi:hypothetical protein